MIYVTLSWTDGYAFCGLLHDPSAVEHITAGPNLALNSYAYVLRAFEAARKEVYFATSHVLTSNRVLQFS